jgi:nucleoid DNA-binding protein
MSDLEEELDVQPKSSKKKKKTNPDEHYGVKMLHGKALIKKIAEKSGFYLYEVEDIMTALVNVVIESLEKGKAVKIEHLVSISPKINPPKMYYNIREERFKQTEGSVTISAKPTFTLLNIIRKPTEE